jgi:hypothetical protein
MVIYILIKMQSQEQQSDCNGKRNCPYVIEYAVLDGAYTDQANIFNQYDSCEKDNFHQTFIDEIVSFMTDFCSDHKMTVTSYHDFRKKFYCINDKVCDRPLFIMRYFIDGEWKIWEPELYDSEIYTAYMLKKSI